MIATEILTRGVEQGIITAEQAERLRALESIRDPLESSVSPDDEQLRFISGFSDIFVTIGLAMFVGAIGYFALRSGGTLGMWIAVAVAAWLLAEFFTRLRRMALPSIVLLIVFAVAVFTGTGTFLGAGARPFVRHQYGKAHNIGCRRAVNCLADCRSLLAVSRTDHHCSRLLRAGRHSCRVGLWTGSAVIAG